MISLLYRLCDAFETVLKIIGTILFCVMIFAVFYEVVMRYVFNAPTFWSEALARYSMIEVDEVDAERWSFAILSLISLPAGPFQTLK